MALKQFLKKLFLFNIPSVTEDFILKDNKQNIAYDVRTDNLYPPPQEKVSANIDENLSYIKKRYSYPENSDIVIREFRVGIEERRTFIFFIDGMAEGNVINLSVIQPMIELSHLDKNSKITSVDDIADKFIWHGQTEKTNLMDTIIDQVNFGGCGVFIDGFDYAFSLDIKGWEHRGINKPENEQSIYGPQEAFGEMLRTNTALVRKFVKDERLICEMHKVGSKSKTATVVMYIKELANENLVEEVRNRVDGVDMDYIISSEELSLMIEEKTFMLTSQILATERPDRVARALSEGRVAIIMNGSPRALILPTNSFELTHSPSDAYMRLPYSNMTRIVRYIAMFISILLPALYLSVTLFHRELIPTYLLYSISASRENVPFPSIFEMFLMELCFEIIREASIRTPGPIGSTLGIVGGLILGQAAVSARIVSPIMIIIVAVTGIGSFATTDYSLGWTYRILRMIFMILASVCGFFGIALGIFVYSVFLAAQKSFGVPFLAPLAEGDKNAFHGSLFLSPIWKNEQRPKFLSPQDDIQEPKISRKWKKKRKSK